MILAYLLWFFFGFIGAHRFYAGGPVGAVSMVLLMALGTFGTGMGIAFAPLLLVIGLGWVALDLFLIPGLVARSREAMRQELIAELITAMRDEAAAEAAPSYPGHEPRRVR